MNEEEKLREIIGQKFAEEDFEFDELNWKKAENMLAKEEKRKKRFLILFFFLIGICGLTAYFIFPREKNANTAGKQIVTKDANDKIPQNSLTLLSNKTTSPSSNTNKQHPNISSAENPGIQNAGNNKNTDNIPAKRKKTILASENNKPVAKTGNNTKHKKTAVSIVNTKKEKRNKKEKDTLNFIEIKNNAGHDLKTTTAKNGISNTDSLIEELVIEKKDPVIPILVADSNTTKATDSAAAGNQNSPEKITLLPKNNPKNIITVEAGSNLLLGWSYGGIREGNGLNPIGGINYTRYLNEKFAASLGVHVTSAGNLGYSNYTAVNTQYSFGVSATTTTITPKKLYQLAVPLKVFFITRKKNMFGAGCTALYLFNTLSRFETTNSGTQVITVTQASMRRGYMDGYSTFNLQATLNYRRQLYGNFGAGAELFFGLTDIKKNDFFNVNSIERMSGFKLILYYNLFKF